MRMRTRTIITVFLSALLITAGLTNLSLAEEKAKPGASKKSAAVKSGNYSVAELFAKKDKLNGKKVTVKGKVVKVSSGIMGKTWVHVQDGTGISGTNDITATTDQTAAVGDKVVINGVLAANKDFGAGYVYSVIIENATITVEK